MLIGIASDGQAATRGDQASHLSCAEAMECQPLNLSTPFGQELHDAAGSGG